MITLKEILSLAKKQALLQYHENHDEDMKYHMQNHKVRATKSLKKYYEICDLESEFKDEGSNKVFKILAINEQERKRK